MGVLLNALSRFALTLGCLPVTLLLLIGIALAWTQGNTAVAITLFLVLIFLRIFGRSLVKWLDNRLLN